MSKSKSANLISQFVKPGEKVSSKPIWIAHSDSLEKDLRRLNATECRWAKSTDWKAEEGSVLLLPAKDGGVSGAVLGLGTVADSARRTMLVGALPRALPAGNFHFEDTPDDPNLAALAWAMGNYRFSRYKSDDKWEPRRLVLPNGLDESQIANVAGAVAMGRDLINTPANDFGPAELEKTARKLARTHAAKIKVVTGDALLKQNFPLIHAVGRASDRAPRLIDFSWGPARAPKITLVGKGITYDTGGLSIKPTPAMLLMKKDMGGAAAVLSLASMIMASKLRVRLRVLVAAADNAISGNAFRPGDVLESRKGITVEIGNTDAEGRLVLADALALADEEKPDVLLTMATLTGAARVALGPDLPPFYATDDDFAERILAGGMRVDDPVWRMPFWQPYDKTLRAKTGDVNHISDGPFAGSITAALFLKRFVGQAGVYAHFDIYGWVPRAKPARPEGGEPQGARALFDAFERTYGQ
ncbi:MAG: leucyl aminopeptidase family protein [Hyphomicrobiaceae bacterium]|nr:leucyl aminopeptidase family protein [Hyphomicrobiaceae bacterium]